MLIWPSRQVEYSAEFSQLEESSSRAEYSQNTHTHTPCHSHRQHLTAYRTTTPVLQLTSARHDHLRFLTSSRPLPAAASSSSSSSITSTVHVLALAPLAPTLRS